MIENGENEAHKTRGGSWKMGKGTGRGIDMQLLPVSESMKTLSKVLNHSAQRDAHAAYGKRACIAVVKLGHKSGSWRMMAAFEYAHAVLVC